MGEPVCARFCLSHMTYRQGVVQNGGTKTQGNSFEDDPGKSSKELPMQMENRGHCFVLYPVGLIFGFSRKGNFPRSRSLKFGKLEMIWLPEKELRKPKLNMAESKNSAIFNFKASGFRPQASGW
ncbi:MAG TPA: hypothetical protein VM223_26335 [Planctomycetota bacterium]|nr:hypothetical protein [Planctomycetota bacterium]